MLMAECRQAKVQNYFGQKVLGVQKTKSGFEVTAENTRFEADRLVIATGGLSIPKIGATGFGYEIAEQFNPKIVTPQAGLVPLTFTDRMKTFCQSLSGLSVAAELFNNRASFAEGLLFTHRGPSGPSILQILIPVRRDETVLGQSDAPDRYGRAADIGKAAVRPNRDTDSSCQIPAKASRRRFMNCRICGAGCPIWLIQSWPILAR